MSTNQMIPLFGTFLREAAVPQIFYCMWCYGVSTELCSVFFQSQLSIDFHSIFYSSGFFLQVPTPGLLVLQAGFHNAKDPKKGSLQILWHL